MPHTHGAPGRGDDKRIWGKKEEVCVCGVYFVPTWNADITFIFDRLL